MNAGILNDRGWSLVMSAEDKPDCKEPEPGTGAADAHADAGPVQGQAPAPPRPRAAGIWGESNRVPARGLVLAIPAGVVLWAVAIYLLTKLI